MKVRPRQHLTNKQRSQRSEKRAADVFGGRLQPASGAINSVFLKGDVKSDRFMVDDKVTKHKRYGLHVDTWRKISGEAWRANRRPAMRVAFDNGPTLYVFDEITAMDLINGTL